MPFGVVSGVGQGMGVLDRGLHAPRGMGGLGVFVSISLNGIFFNGNVFDLSVNS